MKKELKEYLLKKKEEELSEIMKKHDKDYVILNNLYLEAQEKAHEEIKKLVEKFKKEVEYKINKVFHSYGLLNRGLNLEELEGILNVIYDVQRTGSSMWYWTKKPINKKLPLKKEIIKKLEKLEEQREKQREKIENKYQIAMLKLSLMNNYKDIINVLKELNINISDLEGGDNNG